MNIPPIKPESFETALNIFNKQPRALLERDRLLYVHCHETAARTEDPLLASNAFTLGHHTLFVELQQRGIVPLPTNDRIIEVVVHEMLEMGPKWDTDMLRRLKSDHRNFYLVFENWAHKKARPAIVRQNAMRAFRIAELSLQRS